MDLPILDISYKQSHMICGLYVWLLSLNMFSMFIHVVACISTSLFFWLNNIPLYRYTIFCLSVYQLNVWVVSTFWLLWIVLLWTLMCKFLCGHVFLALFGIYLGVELLGHMVTLCLAFWGIGRLFPKWLHRFTFPPATYELPVSLHITCYCLSFCL